MDNLSALNHATNRIKEDRYREGSGWYAIWTDNPEPGACPPSIRKALGRASSRIKPYSLGSNRRQKLQEWWVEQLKEAGFLARCEPQTPLQWAKTANELLDRLEKADVSRETTTWGDKYLQVVA
jgi:hypothetical protein